MPKPLCAFLITLALLMPAAAAMAAPPEGFEWIEEYRGQVLNLRPAINSNPYLYVPITEDLATLEMRARFFPLMGSESVTVTDVDLDLKKGILVFMIRNGYGEGGQLRFIAPLESNETMGQKHIDALLALIREDSGVPLFVVNEDSKTAHFLGSNHAHRFGAGPEFADLQQAKAAGYKPCPACFSPINLLPDFDKEMDMGRLVAVEVRNRYPAVMNDSLQTYVQDVGHRVLDNWPIPLRGYRYRFTVVEAGSPNAVACPGGWIFVYQGLLDLCESEEELEAVLAHEISHVEMRHGLRQLRSAEKAARAGQIAGLVMAGMAVAMDSPELAVAGGLALVVANSALEIALAGYSRDMEMESDAAAVNYLIDNEGHADRHHLAQLLAKLEYMGECETGVQRTANALSSHPTNNVRSDFAMHADIEFFETPLSFNVTTKDKAEIEVRVFGISHHAYYLSQRHLVYQDMHAYEFGMGGGGGSSGGKHMSDTRVFMTVSAGNRIERGTEIKDMELFMAGTWVDFDNKEDTELYPNTTISMVMSRSQTGRVRMESLIPEKIKVGGGKGEAGRSGGGLR